MLIKESFFEKYHITKDDLKKAQLEWQLLENIYKCYIEKIEGLQHNADYIVKSVMGLKGAVHSVKFRVKDAEHLIEKIIRKKIKNPQRIINEENFQDEITDLIGVRVMHLFKDDWNAIHDYIINEWDLHERVVANIREGDSDELYKEKGCEIKIHPAGYRSVHYLINFQPTRKVKAIAEIQVRTIFEEAWSEIDHIIRYPYNVDDTIIGGYLEIFNRLAGSADEMGTYIKMLSRHLREIDDKLNTKDRLISDLQSKINKLNIDKKDKTELNELINLAKRNPPPLPFFLQDLIKVPHRIHADKDLISQKLERFRQGINSTFAELK